MFCNQCGQANSTDAKFCSKCGNKLENTKTQSTNKPQSSKKLSTLRRIWLIFLFVLSLCMILGVFPYQLISGDFELKYIFALLLWGAVFQYTWAQIFPKKSWFNSLLSKSESEPLNIQAIQTIQPPAQTKTTQRKIRPALWNPTAAANWSLLFSPAFGAYIHMLNWKKLGFGEKAKNSRNWFFVSLFLSLLGLGLLVLIAWYFSSAKEQIKYIKTHFGDNYPKNSWGKPLLIAFGVTLVSLIFLVAISSLNEYSTNQPINTKINPIDHSQYTKINPADHSKYTKDLRQNNSKAMTCTNKSGNSGRGIDFYGILKLKASGNNPVYSELIWGVAYIDSNINSNLYTGSLRAKVYAVSTPYYGAALNGYLIGEYMPNFSGLGSHSPNNLNKNYTNSEIVSADEKSINIPLGNYCAVVTLEEYSPNLCNSSDGYCTQAWYQFEDPIVF